MKFLRHFGSLTKTDVETLYYRPGSIIAEYSRLMTYLIVVDNIFCCLTLNDTILYLLLSAYESKSYSLEFQRICFVMTLDVDLSGRDIIRTNMIV